MALVRWDPARELASMEIDRLHNMFSNLYGEGLSRSWMPPVDIYETEQHEVVVKAELPDMKREDISVTFENNVLTLKGERKMAAEGILRELKRRRHYMKPSIKRRKKMSEAARRRRKRLKTDEMPRTMA